MNLRSTVDLIKTTPDGVNSAQSLSPASSPLSSVHSSDDTEMPNNNISSNPFAFTCIPHTKWISCIIENAVDVPMAQVVRKPII